MTEAEILAFVGGLPGVVVQTAREGDGSPEAAWGDSFFFFDPSGALPENQRMPFATIVTSDYPGWDEFSDLNRPGVFRLNISVGREAYAELLGHTPAEHAAQVADYDFTAADRLMPHPVYGVQSWVSIVNPGEATSEQARTLLASAHAGAASRTT
ncbi:MAG TPA: DUF6194 family protein [Actinomycetota bacterium]|nr:DUF6194 family protein [Actinomycetota bacterium]